MSWIIHELIISWTHKDSFDFRFFGRYLLEHELMKWKPIRRSQVSHFKKYRNFWKEFREITKKLWSSWIFLIHQKILLTKWRIQIFSGCKDKFYFRWLENSAFEIRKAASIPFMFNHLKWNFSKSKWKIKRSPRWSKSNCQTNSKCFYCPNCKFRANYSLIHTTRDPFGSFSVE